MGVAFDVGEVLENVDCLIVVGTIIVVVGLLVVVYVVFVGCTGSANK